MRVIKWEPFRDVDDVFDRFFAETMRRWPRGATENRAAQDWAPAAASFRRRTDRDLRIARELRRWMHDLNHHWSGIHWGNLDTEPHGDRREYRVQVYLGEIPPESVTVELYAESRGNLGVERHPLRRERPLSGAAGGFLYAGEVPAARPPGDYTPRIVPAHPEVAIPVEARFIAWYPA